MAWGESSFDLPIFPSPIIYLQVPTEDFPRNLPTSPLQPSTFPTLAAMMQNEAPTTKTPFSPNAPYPQYGTFSPPLVKAAYHASQPRVVAIPYPVVQQQVIVEGLALREPPLPFCGIGIGWALFLLGFLAAIPWYVGAFILFFVALDHREKPGLIACTIAGILAVVPFILNGIRMHPIW